MTKNQKNVLGENLEECSLDPLTGWYRDGCCNTDENDRGLHTVCKPWSFSSVLQQPSRYHPVKGSKEHSSRLSPRTFF